jgi:hypothetical protein
MAAFYAAAGRFEISHLLDAGRSGPGADAEAGCWGVAYCYGTRLEALRSQHMPAHDPDFGRLAELRTDVVCLLVEPGAGRGVRELQPFVRRDSGRQWTFCHFGKVVRPQQLDTGGRVVDSQNPSERFFLHLLNRLDNNTPIESIAAALGELEGETALSFWMMSTDLTIVASWHDPETREGEGVLWMGDADLVRYVASRPIPGVAEVNWERLPSRTVFAISRERRELP